MGERIKTPDNDMLLKGFRMVQEEMYRDDLEPTYREYVQETLIELARNCVNQGLGLEIAKIRDNVTYQQRLKKLKEAWIAGEISL